jgi:hypothetical protein
MRRSFAIHNFRCSISAARVFSCAYSLTICSSRASSNAFKASMSLGNWAAANMG